MVGTSGYGLKTNELRLTHYLSIKENAMASNREKDAAFPATSSGCLVQNGMSLRDWFAGQALANTHYVDAENSSKTAMFAYQIADEMMKLRNHE
jgi:hypothetical protein|tara:strand:- start:537 stop:818 length:282 start_codon:yes stop_codon:yes gene_type:complete